MFLLAVCVIAFGCNHSSDEGPYVRPPLRPKDATYDPAQDSRRYPWRADLKARSDFEMLEASAKAGNYTNQFKLGMMFVTGKDGTPPSDFEARKWLIMAAEQGYAPAQYQLGLKLADLRSIVANDAEAVRWLRAAAEQDVPDAQYHLGQMYYQGRDPKDGQDYSKAGYWFRKAADRGHAAAMLQLGIMNANGEGSSQDFTQAAKWYELSAQRSNIVAQRLLGELYYDGRGVRQNYREAAIRLKVAADAGDERAMLRLAGMYAFGQGVPKDLVEAYKYYVLVASRTDSDAIDLKAALKYVSQVQGQLAPEQVLEGQRRANELQAKWPRPEPSR